MQLFSVGLYQLNIDGSSDARCQRRPVATYGQPDVSGLAAVMTGWTFTGAPDFWNWEFSDFRQPMNPFPDHHQPEAKRS